MAALGEAGLGCSLSLMRGQVDRMARLVKVLLDVSRTESGRLELQLDDFDGAECVRQTAGLFRDQNESESCELEIDVAPGALPVRWDRMRFELVLVNLLRNAVTYGDRRSVRVRLESIDGEARLSVEGKGIGIVAEDQGRIFRRFERAMPSTNYGGLGLGLYIVRRIVEAHEGAITVASSPGQGSLFTVRMPRFRARTDAIRFGAEA